MPKLVNYKFGKLMKAVSLQSGEDYEDWRGDHVGGVGIICIYESQKKRPGEKFIYFFHDDDPEGINVQYLRTTYGEIEENEKEVRIHTLNSEYTFSFGDYGMSDIDKLGLMLNVGFSYDMIPYDFIVDPYTGKIKILGIKDRSEKEE